MMAAFRETNVKGLESAVEDFAKSPEIFDLFAWQQFLEIHHRNNPDPGYFVVELELLFEATWTVLTQANPKTDEASKALTKNLKAAIQKYVSDNNNNRPNLLPEFLTAVPMVKLQKLAATRIFRAHLDSYMRSGIMYIYYFEVFLYVVFTAIFTRLSVKFKSSQKGTYEWDDIVIRDMTIACFCLALYFLLRELAQFHAMYQLGLQRNWFKDFWNYIDLVASGGTIVLLEYYFRMGPGPEYEHFASVIALFVWMKVLGFAKAFSQPIATFVLMLSTIFQDLFSFMAVLVIILVMFGHAFYLVLSDNIASEGDEIDFTNIGGTAWSLYLMILGTFESSVFAGIWAQTLFLFYSFLVVIILLNVLIAIVSDSYDAVLVTSTELFWRSRLELVAEITTTFNMFLQSDLEVWKKRVDEHFEKWIGRIAILYSLEEDHPWANGKNKVALGVRILFSPVLLGLAIAIFFLWLFPVIICSTILDILKDKSYSDTKEKVKDFFTSLYGFDSDDDTSNMNNKPMLVARIIFSPLLVTFTTGFFILWWLPFTFVAFIFGKLYDQDEYQRYSRSWKDKLASMKSKISVVYGFKQDHSWSNKRNKLALLIRILFSPIILIISIPIFLLWYLPFYLYYTILLKTQGPRVTSTEVDLDLKLKSSNSDWSGRVLDIVRRVNAITSSESAKTNAKITALDGVVLTLKGDVLGLKGDVQTLTEDNASLKKLLSEKMVRDDTKTRNLEKMLSAIATKVGAEVELELEDGDEDQKVEQEQNDDKKAEIAEGEMEGNDPNATTTVGQKKTRTHADVAAPTGVDEEEGESDTGDIHNPLIESTQASKSAKRGSSGGVARVGGMKGGSGAGDIGDNQL
ncbi:hypothetical protein TrVE_jg10077 [Triparma verrucosa]|uniref:Ion transport domain-containing protein n=1 Tax=Triparma verrucosa TaxID=1606542 RepID=A0A9W7F985_9STRA|nr:hypothetical protein TrVE_jg10077 [Triparma verrucosa]